ncbi:hypothetical protein ANO14919_048730 [Xylariales sp. No.14919]|nr:hypothetical protein ANO14919_048730 [Xylariales sp. No.14919]
MAMFGTLSMRDSQLTPSISPYSEKGDKQSRHAACDRCRVSKVRCGGEKPSCRKCLSLSRCCIYTTGRKKRKSNPQALEVIPPIPSNFGIKPEQPSGADTPEHQFAELAARCSSFPSMNLDVVSRDYNSSIEEIIGLETPPRQNGSDNTLNGVTHLDSWSFPAFNLSAEPEGTEKASLPSSPPVPPDGDKKEGFSGSEKPLLSQAPGSPRSLNTVEPVPGIATSIGEGQPQPVPTPGKTQNPGTEKRLSACECLENLASSLFACDLWEGATSMDRIRASALNIATYLSLFRDSMKSWNNVRNCHLSCAVRREAALLFILSLNGVAKVQLDLITRLSCRESYNLNLLAEPYADIYGLRPASSPSTVEEFQFQQTSSSTPYLAEESSIGLGTFLSDDMPDQISMLKELIRSQIGHSQTVIQMFRGEWLQAGLDDCCAKLDVISSNLAGQACLLRSRLAK